VGSAKIVHALFLPVVSALVEQFSLVC